jgi:hypothetical protein
VAEPEVKGKGVTSFTPKGEFHAMDCVDMVIGMARGDASRIWDYYTRDRCRVGQFLILFDVKATFGSRFY